MTPATFELFFSAIDCRLKVLAKKKAADEARQIEAN
jgi:hypothetical protein